MTSNKLDAQHASVDEKETSMHQTGYAHSYSTQQWNATLSHAEQHPNNEQWSITDVAKYNLQHLAQSVEYMTRMIKALQSQLKENKDITAKLEEEIKKKDKEIEQLTWLQKTASSHNGDYGHLVDELQKLKRENEDFHDRLNGSASSSVSLKDGDACSDGSNKTETIVPACFHEIFGADIIFANMPVYAPPTPSPTPSERGLIPPPPQSACPSQQDSDSEHALSRQSQSTLSTPPGLAHPHSIEFSSDDSKSRCNSEDSTRQRTYPNGAASPYSCLNGPKWNSRGFWQKKGESEDSPLTTSADGEDEKELSHYLPKGADQGKFEQSRRAINLLCRKHSVDPRTIEWFLRPVNCMHWFLLSEKCVELDRRSDANHCVKNPSAWLTKYFNTLRSGRY